MELNHTYPPNNKQITILIWSQIIIKVIFHVFHVPPGVVTEEIESDRWSSLIVWCIALQASDNDLT